MNVTASPSETRHLYYTTAWQNIEERVGTSTTMDKQYVWGLRYIDELVCRDDATPRRLYPCQDATFSLTAITDAGGTVLERYVFDPYGKRAIYNASWVLQGNSSYHWRIGHQGLTLDDEDDLIYNRDRYVSAQLGRFLRREPNQYVSSVNCYEYLGSNPGSFVDPTGDYLLPPPVVAGPFIANPVADLIIADTILVGYDIIFGGYDAYVYTNSYFAYKRFAQPIRQVPMRAPRKTPITAPARAPSPNPGNKRRMLARNCGCKVHWGRRLGGNPWHDQLATFLSGRDEDYYVTTPLGATAVYDGLVANTVFEVKTGHEWLAPKVAMTQWGVWQDLRFFSIGVQFLNEQSVADECSFNFQVFTDNAGATAGINQSMRPVPLHNDAITIVLFGSPAGSGRGR